MSDLEKAREIDGLDGYRNGETGWQPGVKVIIRERAASVGGPSLSPRRENGGQIVEGIRPRRSVARAAEVEAPHQATGDGLHELLVMQDGIASNAGRGNEWHFVYAAVLAKPILRLPGQTLEPRQPVFVAAADEPAVEVGLRSRDPKRRTG